MIVLILFNFSNLLAQLHPLMEYSNIEKDNSNNEYIVYRIKGRKYYRYEDFIVSKNDTIFKNDTNSLIYYTVFKKRYLFVSYYPEDQKRWAFGFQSRKLRMIDVIDLKKPYRKWHFDFKILENKENWRLGLDQVEGFNPKNGEILFSIKFAINTDFALRPLPNTKKHIPSY